MSSKDKPKPRKQQSASSASKKKSTASSAGSVSTTSSHALSSGFLLTCDPPAKQFILHLNDTKIADKKFILEDLDATHLLIKGEVREEITRKVEEWMDMVRLLFYDCSRDRVGLFTSIPSPNQFAQNVFSNVERVGENLDNS